jgi:hypothetical protein
VGRGARRGFTALAALVALIALVALVVVSTLPRRASAQATPAKAPPARKVVVAPFSPLGDGSVDLVAAAVTVGGGVASVPGVTLVPDKDVRAFLKKNKRKDLEACDGKPECLQELGRLLGAEVVIAGEVGEVGGGQIAYLGAVDVATGKGLASTTAILSGDGAARTREARAAAFRLLAPAAYVGMLKLDIDVPGAVVYVDGRQVGKSPLAPVPLAVGTHALRVTHEQYRDFVRFVDIAFDETSTQAVPLTEFPVVEDEMREQGKAPPFVPLGPQAPRPWYRKPWAIAGFSAAVLVLSAVTVVVVSDGIERDGDVTVDGK